MFPVRKTGDSAGKWWPMPMNRSSLLQWSSTRISVRLLLVLIFVNDLPDCVKSSIMVFADNRRFGLDLNI